MPSGTPANCSALVKVLVILFPCGFPHRLTGIGMGVGLAFAVATTYVLRLLRWRGASAYVEAVCTLTIAYLAFYVAQDPAKVWRRWPRCADARWERGGWVGGGGDGG